MDSKTVLAMQISHINKNRHIINISKNNLFLMLVLRFRHRDERSEEAILRLYFVKRLPLRTSSQ